MADPAVKKEYRGTDGTVGFVYSWDGNDKVGKGEQQIKSIEEGQRVDFDLHFLSSLLKVRPMPGSLRKPFPIIKPK